MLNGSFWAFTSNNTNFPLLQDDVPPTQYYAVFDGHGGVEGADFAAKQFHFRLAKHESFKTNLTEAIGKSIKALDEEYCAKCKRDVRSILLFICVVHNCGIVLFPRFATFPVEFLCFS